MEELTQIEGTIENIIYKNAENGYSVFSVSLGEEEMVCVGNVLGLNEGEHIKVSGSFVMHPFYGRQLAIKTYEKMLPNTELGIERYLSSGVIKGIGQKTARRIVERFGADTFKVIESDPVRLSEIRGISQEKALAIADIYIKQIELKNVMMFLQNLGISNNHAIKIYKQYAENSLQVIKTNPYKIADDIFGIGFKTADSIAEKIGVDRNSIYRVTSGVKYTLSAWAANGHTFMPKEKLYEHCALLMDVSAGLINDALSQLQLESQVVIKTIDEEEAVYLSYYHAAENYCAKKLAMIAATTDSSTKNIDAEISHFEQAQDIQLAARQKEAVQEAMAQGVLVITGGPGTGKTTTINALIRILEDDGQEIMLAAPTGRAAKRMTEATGKYAQTIHRMLQMNALNEDSARQRFARDEENPLETDVLIIDEASMVDILLLHSLLKAIPVGTRLIFVGDVDQLPSVGAGNVLADIIKSGCIRVVVLDEIFRQAQKSAIVMNAHRINKGEIPVFNEKDTDFFLMKKETAQGVLTTIEALITKRLPTYMQLKNATDIQVLSPMRKGPLGVTEMNKLLQEKINPPAPGKKEKELRQGLFREGDKVMQIKNNYNISWITKSANGFIIDEGTGVFNGDQGFVSAIDDNGESLCVTFDDGKIVNYDYSQVDELELAYAITIHKSQGSEYPVVILPILTGPYMLMTKNLLYTGVTRAKTMVVLVGSLEKVASMVHNNMEIKRYSSLRHQLQRAFSVIQMVD